MSKSNATRHGPKTASEAWRWLLQGAPFTAVLSLVLLGLANMGRFELQRLALRPRDGIGSFSGTRR